MEDNKTLDTEIVVSRIKEAIRELNDNDFTLYFFVVDSKNTPNGSMYYIYQLAKTLHDKGYNVKMLYQLENEYTASEIHRLQKKEEFIDPRRQFGGVGEWLGQEYANIPHVNIATTQWSIKPSDFLFIPEAMSSVMFQMYKQKVPCKRFVIQHNFNNITEFIPLGVEWKHYGITDVITSSEIQGKLTQSVFPYVKVTVLPPCIPPVFKPSESGKKLIINVIAKRQSDINRVIKQFYWKYPMYKFVSFRDVRNQSTTELAETLQETPITIWIDEYTPFGYSALAAMRCGNIVIGKVPEVVPEWMKNGDTLHNNGIWCYDINDIPDFTAKAVTAFLNGNDELFSNEETEETNKKYGLAEWSENVVQFITNTVAERMKEFIAAKATFTETNNTQKNEQ